jgi:DNA-directed RNA polymerase subunit RPC12/RpoP
VNPPQTDLAKMAAGLYRCVICGTDWAYAAIRNIARCPACSGGLIRNDAETTTTAIEPTHKA